MNNDTIASLEKSVLGAVLLDNRVIAELPSLEVRDFFDPRAGAVWDAMRRLEQRNKPIDPVTVAAELDLVGKGDAIGEGYIGLCAACVPDRRNAIEYAQGVRDASLRRRVLMGLDAVLSIGKRDGGLSGADLLTRALEALSGFDAEQPDEAATIGQLLKRRASELEALVDDRERGMTGLTGLPTGSAALDRLIGGWQRGIVSLVAARPGMGKSSLGLATADATTKAGLGVHLFSLEDSWHAYADRAMARQSRVAAETIRSTRLDRDGMSKLGNAITHLSLRKNWLVDNRSGITADEIVRSVRRRMRENQTRLVLVDYVQLVRRPRNSSVHEELTQVVETLADAAKHDGVAYVVMSQLNRGVEQRGDKRPQLSDLRESGSLEERAKCVVALYRGAYYGEKPKPHVDYDERDRAPTDEEYERQVQLLVLKNSNGATGRVFASWDGPTLRLE